MGCCSSIRFESLTPEQRVCEAENKLEIKSMPAERIDKFIHRYGYKLQITQTKFELLCKSLMLEKTSLGYIFFKYFYNENEDCYDVRELSSAGIIFAQGTEKEKIKLLFQNYDNYVSNSLDSKEIKLMIVHLTNISLVYSIKLAISNENSEDLSTKQKAELVEYQNKLSSIKLILEFHYQSVILEINQENITFEEFQKKLLEKDIIALINPHEMREFSERLASMLSHVSTMVERMMHTPESKNAKLSRLHTMKSKKKKKKSRRMTSC